MKMKKSGESGFCSFFLTSLETLLHPIKWFLVTCDDTHEKSPEKVFENQLLMRMRTTYALEDEINLGLLKF